MEAGRYYKTGFKNGDVIYMLVGDKLKNGANKALMIEGYIRKAKNTTTSFLSASQWREIADTDIPPVLLAKLGGKWSGDEASG
jgi:hypothetical protein